MPTELTRSYGPAEPSSGVRDNTLPALLREADEARLTAVRSLADVANDPHASARRVLQRQDGMQQPAPAPRFSRTPGRLHTPPGEPGTTAQAVRDARERWGV